MAPDLAGLVLDPREVAPPAPSKAPTPPPAKRTSPKPAAWFPWRQMIFRTF